jgi:tetratricopeptide (TPR) repeat protein
MVDLDELCLLGQVAYQSAHLDAAVAHWLAALQLCEVVGSASEAGVAVTRAHLLTNLGAALHENCAFDRAEDMLLLALEAYDALPPDALDVSERQACVASVNVNLGLAWNALGHWADAEERVLMGTKSLQQLLDSGHTDWLDDAMRARANLGKLMADRYWLIEAEVLLSSAYQHLLGKLEQGSSEARWEAGSVLLNLGIVKFRSGQIALAQGDYRCAFQMLSGEPSNARHKSALLRAACTLGGDSPGFYREQSGLDPIKQFQALVQEGHENLRHELAFAHIANLRAEPTQEGAYDHVLEALQILEGLALQGHYFALRDLALAYGRLAAEFASSWAMDSSETAYRTALQLMRLAANNGNAQTEYMVAHMTKNMCHPLGDTGRELTSARYSIASAIRFSRLKSRVTPTALMGMFYCKSLLNVGTALCMRQRFVHAQRMLGFVEKEMVDDPNVAAIGRERQMPSFIARLAAHVYVGLGDRAAAQVHIDKCAEESATSCKMEHTYWGGMAFWPHLATDCGDALDHAWNSQLAEERMEHGPRPGSTYLRSARVALESVLPLRAMIPNADWQSGAKVAVALSAALRRLADLTMPREADAWRSVRVEWAKLTIEVAGHWIRRSSPDDLLASSPVMEQMLTCVREAVLLLDEPELTAQWFLRTYGLRAQWRGGTTGLAVPETTHAWRAIDELDRLRLAQSDSSDDLQRRSRRRALILPLAQQGQLEPQLELDIAAVEQRLVVDEPLLLAARSGLKLVLIQLRKTSQGALDHRHWLVDLPEGASTDCSIDVAAVDCALLAVHCGAVRKGPGWELDPYPAAAPVQVSVEWAQDRLQALAALMATVLRDVLAGSDRVNLVPSGDLHMMPWHWFLRQSHCEVGCLRVFPTVADWWHHTAEPTTPGPASPTRWLSAAYDAHDTGDLSHRLNWVPVQSALTRRLWPDGIWLELSGAGGSCADASSSCALMASGHGVAPGGNSALAGVWIGTDAAGQTEAGAPILLSAQTFERLPRVRRLVLSCCVLGRTRDIFGEPLGLIAQSFQHGVRFAVGSLVQLADMDAAIFSLAYLWRLHRAEQSGESADWVKEFLSLQEDLLGARWPDGFGPWLETQLPRVLAEEIPDAEVARRDDDAWELRQHWRRGFADLARQHGLAGPPPASQPLTDFVGRLAKHLAERPPASLSHCAPWWVVLGA